jgi:hypothetical protein
MADFYEKRKLDYLNAIGREEFYDKLFNADEVQAPHYL